MRALVESMNEKQKALDDKVADLERCALSSERAVNTCSMRMAAEHTISPFTSLMLHAGSRQGKGCLVNCNTFVYSMTRFIMCHGLRTSSAS